MSPITTPEFNKLGMACRTSDEGRFDVVAATVAALRQAKASTGLALLFSKSSSYSANAEAREGLLFSAAPGFDASSLGNASRRARLVACRKSSNAR
jgi:hypothetical protein